jgi:hypothetical protein
VEEAVLRLFRQYGVTGEVSEKEPRPADEALFCITPKDAAKLRCGPELTEALQAFLHRKVWITTQPF